MPVVEVNFSCGVGRIRLFCVFSGFQDFRISGFSFLLPINKSFTRDFLQETVGNCCSQHSTHGNVGAMQLRKQVLTCSSRQKKVFCSTPLLSVFTKKKGLNKKTLSVNLARGGFSDAAISQNAASSLDRLQQCTSPASRSVGGEAKLEIALGGGAVKSPGELKLCWSFPLPKMLKIWKLVKFSCFNEKLISWYVLVVSLLPIL